MAEKKKYQKRNGIHEHGDSYWLDFTYRGVRVRERVCSINAQGSLNVSRRALAARKTEVAEGRFLNVKKETTTTFKQLSEMYAQEFGEKLKHWKVSGTVYLRHLVDHFGDMPIDRIFVTHVMRYKEMRSKVVGSCMVNRELSLLRRIYNLAGSYWRNPVNENEPIFQGVNPVKIVKGGALQFFEEVPRGVYLTKGKLITLLDACDAYLKDYIMFAVVTGLRFSEQHGLTAKHINTEAGYAYLPMTKNGQPRYVPLCGIARSILDSGADFSSDPRRRSWLTTLKKAGMRRKLSDKECDCLEIPRGSWKNDIHWHDLRHTTATYLEDTDVPGEKIKAIMGHTEASVTDIYKNLHPIKKVQKLIPHVESLDRYLADIYWRPLSCGTLVEKQNEKDSNQCEPMTSKKMMQDVAQQQKA